MISIIIVTYNRKLLLKECLEGILVKETKEKAEIVVIDNYSCDGTENLIKDTFGNGVKLFRNRERISLMDSKIQGINLAAGEKIAFIDDDCLASKDWLNKIENSLNDCDFVGGAVLPAANVKFPWWWRKSLDWLIGVNSNPNKKFLPLGSNMAFNKNVLHALKENRKNISLRCDEFLPYLEDNYRIKEALALGFSLKINQDMVVYHRIPAERLRIGYLIKRCYREGRAMANYEHRTGYLLFSFFSLP
ncbi:MAG: glycosyltransferase family 2 protein, partial [Candidatus Omnitrophota bacterium]